jgi:hypothetical protein
MALQSSGPISMNDMNTDRGIASGTQINLATAGTAYSVSYTTNGSNDLRFSEFYGASTAPPPTPTAPAFRSIELGNPPGDNTTLAACAITSGITKYISAFWSITNGLEIFDDFGLTIRTFTMDPTGGNYLMLYDSSVGFRYAVTFDGGGLVDTVYDCLGGSPIPPSPPPSPTPTAPAPTPTAPSPTPTAPAPTPTAPAPTPTAPAPTPTAPTPTPTPASTSYLLNSSPQGTGFDACSQYNSFSRATYYSLSGTIGSGTSLYTDAGLTTFVSDGYYSNGTNYWYFAGGSTADSGFPC